MARPFLFLLFLLFLASVTAESSQAQRSRLVGVVVDAHTDLALDRTSVVLEGTRTGTATDRSGRFELALPGEPPYVVVISRVGYDSASLVVESGSAARPLEVRLVPTAVDLPEIFVEQASMTGGLTGLAGIPGSAHYLSPRALERFAHQDIHSILREVPGVNVQDEEGFGLRPHIGIRGTGTERSAKVTIMEDGVPIAPAAYASPSAYFFPAVGRMNGIEVRKGSSQIRYGPITTGGAINLLSTPIPERRSGAVRLLGGTDDNLLLHAWAGDGQGRVSWLLETYRAQTSGFKDLDGGGDTGFDRTEFVGKVRLSSRPGAAVRQSLLVKGVLSDDDSRETYLGLTDADFAASPARRYAGSQEDNIAANQRQLMLRHRIAASDRLEIITTAYTTFVSRNWYKLDAVRTGAEGNVGIGALVSDPASYPAAYALVTGAPVSASDQLKVKANNREYTTTGLQTEASYRLGTGTLEAGLRLHEDREDRFQWADSWVMDGLAMRLATPGLPGSDANRIDAARAFAAWAQHRLEAGRLTVVPGVRLEFIELTRDDYGKADPDRSGTALASRRNVTEVVVPGIGLAYALREGWTLFGGLHRGFAPPGSTDGTRPESAMDYELGTRVDRGGTRGEIVAFYNDYTNLLGADLTAVGGSGSGDLFNGGSARSYGLEVSGSRNLGHLVGWKVSVPVQVAFSLTRAQFTSSFDSEFEPWGEVHDGDFLAYLPERTLTWSVGVETGRFDLELSGRHAGWMRSTTGTGTPTGQDLIPGHFVLDASADVAVQGGVRLFATVRNVTDAVYVAARRPAGLRPGLPRTFLAGVRATF